MSTLEQIKRTIEQLENQRAVLGDEAIDAALQGLHQKLAEMEEPSGQAKAETVDPSLLAERKLVTIMFADISGFTALAERLDPEAVRDLTNQCFDQLVPVVEKYGGTVDKFIGDEIMALFGAPLAHENDPERALRAALEMLSALQHFNQTQKTDLGIHFGINTGRVIAGGIGTSGKQEYSVMGDAVNLASRLEELSERGEILVGADTYRQTAPLFRFQPLEPVLVKGKAKAQSIYRLLGRKSTPGRVRGLETRGISSPLVGREAEFNAIQKRFSALSKGQGGVLTLTGEAGVGKSRLMAETHTLVDNNPLQWLEGRSLSFSQSISYIRSTTYWSICIRLSIESVKSFSCCSKCSF